METRIWKDSYYGWRAKTVLEFGKVDIEICAIRFRYEPQLKTIASCNYAEEIGGCIMRTYRAYEDYYESVAKSTPKRVTEKVVTEQHNDVLSDIENIKKRAAAYYMKKGETELANAILGQTGEGSN